MLDGTGWCQQAAHNQESPSPYPSIPLEGHAEASLASGLECSPAQEAVAYLDSDTMGV